jgi:hypothetical protein
MNGGFELYLKMAGQIAAAHNLQGAAMVPNLASMTCSIPNRRASAAAL